MFNVLAYNLSHLSHSYQTSQFRLIQNLISSIDILHFYLCTMHDACFPPIASSAMKQRYHFHSPRQSKLNESYDKIYTNSNTMPLHYSTNIYTTENLSLIFNFHRFTRQRSTTFNILVRFFKFQCQINIRVSQIISFLRSSTVYPTYYIQ